MSDLTPVAGVVYNIQLTPDPLDVSPWQYAPVSDDDDVPWCDVEEGRRQFPKAAKIVGIAYSPHPPEYADPVWRTGTLRGVVEETAPIFEKVYARGGQGSSATDLLFDLVKIHEIITDHRISAGIERPEKQ